MPIKNIVIGQPVSREKYEFAKSLRREMTPAEKILWDELRPNKFHGIHFRRQQIIDGYIVDFYGHAVELVVELDGDVHETQIEYDAQRDAHLASRGLCVLRFTNEEVLINLEGVLQKIFEACR